ncbi:MAG TPA: acylphosphatase [Actinomycetota bacterium]
MGGDPRVRRHVVVRGRVQGVWFRVTCAREAEARHVAGWVRNREDGDVEAVFEGQPEDVESMLAWCRRGPSGARIDEVVAVEEDPSGRTGFAIVG